MTAGTMCFWMSNDSPDNPLARNPVIEPKNPTETPGLQTEWVIWAEPV
jgi:hypothetical protein